jgi:hypothetical protein
MRNYRAVLLIAAIIVLSTGVSHAGLIFKEPTRPITSSPGTVPDAGNSVLMLGAAFTTLAACRALIKRKG